MRTLWAGAAVFGLAASSAVAETRYDHCIEQAAIVIVAGKIGDIRGGFAFDAKPVFVTAQDPLKTGSVPPAASANGTPSDDGLAPAVEGKALRTLF
jgi:hypothetical protein